MEFELENRLRKEFAPDIHRLSTLLDRDLTSWCHGQLCAPPYGSDTSCCQKGFF
jgi:hypothetical protein